MSGPYPPSGVVGPPDPSDPNYYLYATQYGQPIPQASGPPPHLDGSAFWYRRDTSDVVYPDAQSLAMYGRGNLMQPLENPPKHRRTRSGCFTCRSRRVKCDETRPVCDRCKKGNRECEFPQPSGAKRSKHTEHRASASTSPRQDHKAEDFPSTLNVIKDESDEDAIGEVEQAAAGSIATDSQRPARNVRSLSAQSLNKKTNTGQSSEASVTSKEKETTPSTDTSSSKSRSETPSSSVNTSLGFPTTSTTIIPVEENPRLSSARWLHLKPAMQKYLQFQRDHMTYYHYFYKIDPANFIHTDFIDMALSFEPLLYAVVAFAAYHHTLRYHPDGDLSVFLSYYSKSLTSLRRHLARNPNKYSQATILTVLQLATFEEYLGDWANLVGHHRAAHLMLLSLYKPDRTGGPGSVMETETTRNVFSWYARFDVIAGLLGGNETILDRSWYVACIDWYAAQVDDDDMEDVDSKFQLIIATNRMIGMDMAILFSRMGRGQISLEDFQQQNEGIRQRLEGIKLQAWKLNDEYYTVKEFPWRVPLTDADIVDPYVPGGLFENALWVLNFVWVDWYAVVLMHQYQTSLILQQPIPMENLQHFAREQCRIYETIKRYPHAPEGAILGGHASLGLAVVFLPKDERHINWARHKLYDIERRGYCFPPTFRNKMAEMWGIESVGGISGWWLDAQEGMVPLLEEVRRLAEDRTDEDRSRRPSEDETGPGSPTAKDPGGSKGIKEDLRDMRAIFSKLNVKRAGGSNSAGSPMSGTGDEESPRSEATAGSATSAGVHQTHGGSSGFSPPASSQQLGAPSQKHAHSYPAEMTDPDFGVPPPAPGLPPATSVESAQETAFIGQKPEGISPTPSQMSGASTVTRQTTGQSTAGFAGRSSRRQSRVGGSGSQSQSPPQAGEPPPGDRMSGVWS